jgi:hypothetical protein
LTAINYMFPYAELINHRLSDHFRC